MFLCKLGGPEMIIKLLLCGLVTTMFVCGVGLVLWEVAKFMTKNMKDDEMYDS